MHGYMHNHVEKSVWGTHSSVKVQKVFVKKKRIFTQFNDPLPGGGGGEGLALKPQKFEHIFVAVLP